MKPWANRQKNFVIVFVFRFDRFINSECAINIFLIPKSVNQHHRNIQWLRCQNFIYSLIAPKCIITRMLQNFSPESNLLQTIKLSNVTGGGIYERVVIIKMIRPPVDIVFAIGFLLKNV